MRSKAAKPWKGLDFTGKGGRVHEGVHEDSEKSEVGLEGGPTMVTQ